MPCNRPFQAVVRLSFLRHARGLQVEWRCAPHASCHNTIFLPRPQEMERGAEREEVRWQVWLEKFSEGLNGRVSTQELDHKLQAATAQVGGGSSCVTSGCLAALVLAYHSLLPRQAAPAHNC